MQKSSSYLGETLWLVIAAMCLGAGSPSARGATVDGIHVVSPVVDGNREVIAPDAVLIVDIEPGWSQPGVISDGQGVAKAALVGLDAMGETIPGVFFDISLAVTTWRIYDDGGNGVSNLMLDLSKVNQVQLETFLQTIGVSSFRLVVTTADINLSLININGVQTKWSLDEHLDKCFEYEFPPPLIRTQPQSIVIDAGAPSVVLSVEATGAPPLSYEWRRNGASLMGSSTFGGADTPTLTISSLQASHTDMYTVTVSSPYGSDTSDGVIVAVRSNTCDGDANGDGVVNFDDINAVITNWLNFCP